MGELTLYVEIEVSKRNKESFGQPADVYQPTKKLGKKRRESGERKREVLVKECQPPLARSNSQPCLGSVLHLPCRWAMIPSTPHPPQSFLLYDASSTQSQIG
jgi:hypothetical protein